jgi:hypothetical protein
MSTGGYEWSIAADHSWAKCLEPVGEAFDDGRYRQVSYKAFAPNCQDVLVRVAGAADSTVQPVEQIMTFNVLPAREPVTEGYKVVVDLDVPAAFEGEISVEAGSNFLVKSSELQYIPNGFAWEEPVYEFKCVKVLNKNFGDFNTCFRVWEIQANPEVCTEEVPLVRKSWWTGEDKTANLKINVIPVPCENVCEIGKKRASATQCTCIDVPTTEPIGALFEAHKIAVGTTVRVVMKE